MERPNQVQAKALSSVALSWSPPGGAVNVDMLNEWNRCASSKREGGGTMKGFQVVDDRAGQRLHE